MRSKRRNKIIGAFLGTIVEYYDYSLYGFSAGVIATKFFPTADHLTSLMNVFAVYAVAYFSKPIGSIIFGWIGDTYGRKMALSITIIGIVIPTMAIGLLPEYSEVGIWSTVTLILCRFTQGIFIAGEYDGAAIYVIEHLGKKFQFTASAATRATGVVGLLLGTAMTNFFNAHIFPGWGWRIPFLLSIPMALITLYYRRQFEETPDFQVMQQNKILRKSFANLIKTRWSIILIVIFVAGGFGATYQISIIFMKQYLPLVLPQTTLIISTVSILIVLCFGVSMSISGIIADRFGHIVILKASLFGTIIACIFLTIAIKYQMLNLALASCLMLSAFIAPFNALAHAIIIKVFPISERYRAVSFGHTIGSMLMSGTANYVCVAAMKSLDFSLFPILYLSFFVVLSYYMIGLFNGKDKASIHLTT